jgi:hypothetical protein
MALSRAGALQYANLVTWEADVEIIHRGSPSDRVINRRNGLRLAGAAALTAGLAPVLSSCAAAAPAAEFVAENPATWEWLTTLANSVAASVIADTIENTFKGIFQSWRGGTAIQASKVSNTYPWYRGGIRGVTTAPAVLIGLSESKDGDPLTDGLLVTMQSGTTAVVLPGWSWQGLSMFIGAELHGKMGNDLAEGRQLCSLTLIPSKPRLVSGNSPLNTVGYVTYKTTTGWVEISRQTDAGNSTVEVLATNLYSQNGTQTSRTFRLPTKVSGN